MVKRGWLPLPVTPSRLRLTHDTDTIKALLSPLQPSLMPVQGSRVDLGLIKAWEQLGYEKSALKVQSDNWRPWRSYAANLLWRSLTP